MKQGFTHGGTDLRGRWSASVSVHYTWERAAENDVKLSYQCHAGLLLCALLSLYFFYFCWYFESDLFYVIYFVGSQSSKIISVTYRTWVSNTKMQVTLYGPSTVPWNSPGSDGIAWAQHHHGVCLRLHEVKEGFEEPTSTEDLQLVFQKFGATCCLSSFKNWV